MLVDHFIDYLKYERNYSPQTIKSYEDDLRALESFYKSIDEDLTWQTLDPDIVRQWMMNMMKRQHAATSVNRRLSATRSFYRYLLKRGYIEKDPMRLIQGPKKNKPLPYFLKESEINELFDGSHFSDDFKGKRDKAILMTFYATGMRRAELLGLTVQSFDKQKREVKVLGKRNKQRIIPYGEELEQTLADYESSKESMESTKHCEAYFCTDKGCPLQENALGILVKNYLTQVSNLKKLSPHVLRHTFATSMLNHNADLKCVKELLGHESLATTEIYTHTTFEELKKVYNKAHPRA